MASFMRCTLGCDDVFWMGLHLYRGEARRIPATAQRFHEEHAGHQPLPVDLRQLLLVGQQILLRGDDVEITHQTAGVPVGGDIQRSARRVYGLLLGSLRFAEDR